MRVCLSHWSALWYWRNYHLSDSYLGSPVAISGTELIGNTGHDVRACVPEQLFEECKPVHILVNESSQKRPTKAHCTHIWNGPLSQGAFYKSGMMYVSSPSFLFLQMARYLTEPQLVALGMELCGFYVPQVRSGLPQRTASGLLTRVEPLTCVDDMRTFAEKMSKYPGSRKAIHALGYVIDNSRSPMETMVCLLLCLPARLGGYGLPKPEMNARIELDEDAKRIAGRQYCQGDLCWQSKKLDIEYNGEIHAGFSQLKSDTGRKLGIESMGYKVITLTSSQVYGLEEFDVVANAVAKHLGHRLRSQLPDLRQRREVLRDELEAWMA